jgi:hypothetical protein
LHDFTGIEPISIDFTPPDDDGVIYWNKKSGEKTSAFLFRFCLQV